jgi:hypothetical protein
MHAAVGRGTTHFNGLSLRNNREKLHEKSRMLNPYGGSSEIDNRRKYNATEAGNIAQDLRRIGCLR